MAVVLASCSTPKPIKPQNFNGFSEINKGESATLKWFFLNADYVSFDNRVKQYGGKDSVVVSPLESTVYKITAYNDNDSSMYVWQVIVNENNISGMPGLPEKLEVSFNQSNYFIGLQEISKGLSPAQVKVIKTEIGEQSEVLSIKSIVLDKNGNFLTGLDKAKFALSSICPNGNEIIDGIEVNETPYDENTKLAMQVIMDNSAAAEYNYPALEYTKAFLKEFPTGNLFGFEYYNALHQTVVEMQDADDAYAFFRDEDLDLPSGLTAMYKALYKSLNTFGTNSFNGDKVLVILAFSPDNHSIIYEMLDIIKLAQKNKIAIYPVSIGNSNDTYSLKYLAKATGGKYYKLGDDNIAPLKDILGEIYNSHRANYTLTLDKATLASLNCNQENLQLSYQAGIANLNDEFEYSITPVNVPTRYQSIASFDFKSDLISEIYSEALQSLIKVLKDNPQYSIELIGHSSIEGSGDVATELAFKRAKNIQDMLVGMGVPPSQIKVKSEGQAKPIYYFQQSKWQQYYNRRVELRWLDPANLPYEILADLHNSEESAQKNVDFWENKGFRAYFERVVADSQAQYRVKLWGYSTLKDAQNAANKINKTFNKKYYVD